jgi:hypothetical protein
MLPQHTSGLAAAWAEQGVRWLCFFQDTNGLVFRALPAALGALCRRMQSLEAGSARRLPPCSMTEAWHDASAVQ